MSERLTNAEKYCFTRSWRLRRCRGCTRYLIRNTLCYLPPKPPHVADPAEWRESLRVNLEAKIKNDNARAKLFELLEAEKTAKKVA